MGSCLHGCAGFRLTIQGLSQLHVPFSESWSMGFWSQMHTKWLRLGPGIQRSIAQRSLITSSIAHPIRGEEVPAV